jgi:antitoxin component of MazEF toxin-antitoxin module
MHIKVQKIGNKFGLKIPKSLLRDLNIRYVAK